MRFALPFIKGQQLGERICDADMRRANYAF